MEQSLLASILHLAGPAKNVEKASASFNITSDGRSIMKDKNDKVISQQDVLDVDTLLQKAGLI